MTLIFDNSDTTLAWVVWLYPDGDAEAVQAKTVPPLGVVVFDVRTVAAKIEMVAVCVGTNHRLAGDFPVTDRAVYTVPLRAPPILPTP